VFESCFIWARPADACRTTRPGETARLRSAIVVQGGTARKPRAKGAKRKAGRRKPGVDISEYSGIALKAFFEDEDEGEVRPGAVVADAVEDREEPLFRNKVE